MEKRGCNFEAKYIGTGGEQMMSIYKGVDIMRCLISSWRT